MPKSLAGGEEQVIAFDAITRFASFTEQVSPLLSPVATSIAESAIEIAAMLHNLRRAVYDQQAHGTNVVADGEYQAGHRVFLVRPLQGDDITLFDGLQQAELIQYGTFVRPSSVRWCTSELPKK